MKYKGINEKCIVHDDIDQKTDEWFKLKAGKCSSSEKGLLAAKKGFETYLIQKEAELHLAVFEDGYTSKAMNDGIELEPIARDIFAEKYLLDIIEAGFVERPDLNAGWSPDGLIMNGNEVVSGIEVKCRGTVGHYRVIKEGLDQATLDQMQFAMALTDLPYMYYIGYNPNFKEEHQLIVLKIKRIEVVCKMLKVLMLDVKNKISV